MSVKLSTERVFIVCGGRGYADAEAVAQTLGAYTRPGDTIVHGGARGADTLADLWAGANGRKSKVYPADWKKHGLAAGPIRNQKMLDENAQSLAGVIAFKGGRGTADMVRRALDHIRGGGQAQKSLLFVSVQ